MQVPVTGEYRRILARGAAVLLVSGAAAGCSSDVARFSDSLFTNSTGAQQPAPVYQAYPGDVDQTYTGSINGQAGVPRPQGGIGASGMAQAPVYNAPAPVYSSQPSHASAALTPVTAGAALAPVTRSSLAQVDATVTNSTARVTETVQPLVQTAQAIPAAVAAGPGGWTATGGTRVTIKDGETLYNLSRRFGVPVEAIQQANGLSAGSAIGVGQQIVIPTYVHSAGAPVSAPDANPNVADARSSTGTRYDIPADKVPVPQAPGERLAVLPQQPKLKEQDAAAQATASAQPAAGAASGGAYTVVAGDTLSGISRKTGVSAESLKQANGLSSGLIRVGQKLVIPAGGTVPAQTQVATAAPAVDRSTTTGTVAAQPAAYTPPQATEKVIQQAALDTSSAPDASGISRMRWPVNGRVISGFGDSVAGKRNDGIDIAVPTGTSVKAAENGVVIYAGDGLKEFGNTVLVRHEDGLVTVYGHASEINVQRGQKVRRGEEIAKAGMSGSADTPKLHFEVRKDSSPVNPSKFLD